MKEPALLIACALAQEAALLREHLPPGDWRIEATGLGVTSTRRRLSDLLTRMRPRLLVFTGSAGGLDPALPSGAVVFPERWLLGDGPVIAPDADTVEKLRERGWKVEGTGCTVAGPVVEPARRMQIWRDRQASVCDMEAAAALEIAAGLKIPAVALKVVADSFEQPQAASDKTHFQTLLRAVMPNLAAALARLLEDLRLRS